MDECGVRNIIMCEGEGSIVKCSYRKPFVTYGCCRCVFKERKTWFDVKQIVFFFFTVGTHFHFRISVPSQRG